MPKNGKQKVKTPNQRIKESKGYKTASKLWKEAKKKASNYTKDLSKSIMKGYGKKKYTKKPYGAPKK